MSRRIRRELASRLVVLVGHLLKWQRQPSGRSPSWSATIREQRKQIVRTLRDWPSLRPILDEMLVKIYVEAREDAVAETGLSAADFPAGCPFSADEILSSLFLPE